MRIRSLVIGSSLTALAAAGLVGSTASATPPSVPPPIPSPAPPPEASLDGPHNWHSNGIKLKISGDAVVRNFTLTYGPGVNSGWHRHPGLVMATVQSGSVYRTLPCQHRKRFGAGHAFVEVGPHFVENRGSVDAVLIITQIAPAGTTGAAFREDLPAPNCHPKS